MEKILEEDDDFNARALPWEQLGYDAGSDVCGKTIKRHMGTTDDHKCLACRKRRCNEKTKAKRVEVREIWKERYPEKENWHSVHFSDECHYGWDLKTLSVLSESLMNKTVKIAYKKAILKEMAPKKENRNNSIHELVLVMISSLI